MDKRFKDLIDQGDHLFSQRSALLQLWQEIAENFYPERADFTFNRNMGDDFASNLDTSYPIIARRDLGNAFGAMLRPPGKRWFKIGLKRANIEDEEGRRWLEMAENVQRRAIYDINSGFVRATKEADHDFAAFGQAVISSEPVFMDPPVGAILFHQSHHLRDVVWSENSFRKIDHIQKKWCPGARELMGKFPKTVSETVKKMAEKTPYETVNVRHIVIASKNYEKKFRQPWVSIFIDTDNETVLEEVGSWIPRYIIPRWETVSGSQYAYSPATVAALPDARLLQAMTDTLLTAGEWAVNPPLIGVQEAIKSAIEAYPGGFTAVDAQYDERLGEVLRPLDTGKDKTIPLNLKMNQDIRLMIADSFYLTKLALPAPGLGGMSPFEVSQRVEEFIRQNLPLFEPMEQDYNGALMEQDFEILLRGGAFGPIDTIPESLRGQETAFQFESPLRESMDRIKSQQFIESSQLLGVAAQLDPVSTKMLDVRRALRDSLRGIGAPATWLLSEKEMEAVDQAAQTLQQAEQAAMMVGTGAQVMQQVGMAGKAMKEAMMPANSGKSEKEAA